MKISLIIAEHGYSFVLQAKALAAGLAQLNIPHQLLKISQAQLPLKSLQEFNPEVVVSIGDWHDYEVLVAAPEQAGFRTIPWLVADEAGQPFVEEYNKLPAVLTTSHHALQTMQQGGIRAALLRVVPEAVDSDYWQQIPAAALASFLQLLSIDEPAPLKFNLATLREKHIPLLFTTGGYATGKGVQEVFAALATIDPALPWVYVIKTWPSTKSFQYSLAELELVEKYGLNDRVRYIVGEFSTDFMRALMTAADIYVSPSRHEGFGLPLIEAQLCEKPVVTINATATKETVVHEQTGLLAAVDATASDTRADVTDLAKHLERLLRDPMLRQRLGHAGREHAIVQYSPPVIAQKMVTMLEEILA